jgi:outer membrane protein assembly factor BamB
MDMRTVAAAILSAVIASVALRGANAPKPGVDWPQFRGIAAQGISDGYPTPAEWNIAQQKNVRWKATMAGLGLSSPIVWGKLLCVTTAISGQKDAGIKAGLYGNIDPVVDDTPHEWRVACLDKNTGAKLWERTAYTGVPKIKRHTKSTHANSTLATDGQRLIAFFGSEGLYAYDLKGTLLWKKNLGVLDAGFYMVPEAQWETGSSPIIHDGVVVVQADVQKGSFLAAFDASSGRELWRVTRDDVPTWSTPTVYQTNGRSLIAVNGMRHAGAYDLKTGKEVWKLSGGGDIPVPTPVVQDGLIYITNAHGAAAPVYAIRTSASGDISLASGAASNDGVAWSQQRDGGYMCSPLVYRGLVYIVKFNGVLSAYDARNGDRKFQERLAGGTAAFTASPVAADGKIYLANEDGQMFVLKAGSAYEQLAVNDMGAPVLATPAISEGHLFVRTAREIIDIAGPK